MNNITEKKESYKEVSFSALKMEQPMGEFFIGMVDWKTLCDITYVDVRRILSEKRQFESYLGIQRPLNKDRVKEISGYVNTVDACFPTAVILAVNGECASYDENNKILTLNNVPEPSEGGEVIIYKNIAKVLDGQHRIEGLRNNTKNEVFDVNVSIFIDADIADQGYLFSTVNLAQTKVNKSLVYDLFGLAKTRSPQRTCHNIAVALDKNESSPFFKKIKRLGVSTEGRFNETITQATFVESLIRYICKDRHQQISDRDAFLSGKTPQLAQVQISDKLIFRNMFIEEKDIEITNIVWNYFEAIQEKWPTAWDYTGKGLMLNRTNGFKALMRLLRDVYLYFTSPGGEVSKDNFIEFFERVKMTDNDFTIDRYKPGSSGESELYRDLKRFLE